MYTFSLFFADCLNDFKHLLSSLSLEVLVDVSISSNVLYIEKVHICVTVYNNRDIAASDSC